MHSSELKFPIIKPIDYRYTLNQHRLSNSSSALVCSWDLLVSGTYLIKFFAVFFFFEFLPVPVNLDVLFMRWDDFVLNFVGSLLLVLLLKSAALCLPLVGFCLDLVDGAVSRSDQLLKRAYTAISRDELVLADRKRCVDLPLASSILASPFLGTSTLSWASFLSPGI